MTAVAIHSDGFPVHPDVISLARYGYDIRVSGIAAKLGFHKSVAQEVYEQVSSGRWRRSFVPCRGQRNNAAKSGLESWSLVMISTRTLTRRLENSLVVLP